MMKRIVNLLMVLLAVCAGNDVAQADEMLIRYENPKPRMTYERVSQNGVELSYTHIDAPATYKVPEEDKGFSNGFSDNSFTFDWPLTLNGKDAVTLQNVLLDHFAVTDFETGEVRYRPASVEELVKERTHCRFSEEATPAWLPDSAQDNCLKDVMDVGIYWITSRVIGFEFAVDQYYGGGTGASVMVGSYYLNYDIENQRELTADLCFLPGLETVIAAELQCSPELWDFLWDEYKSEPFVPKNFKIDDDSITFFFPRYEIAPGAAGIVDVTIPIENILPYASEAFQAVLRRSQDMAGAYCDESKMKFYRLSEVDKEPFYPEGDAAMLRDLAANLEYPSEAVKNGIQGRVLLILSISEMGTVGGVRVGRSLSPECDQSAIEAARRLKFEPALLHGQPVKSFFVIPVIFKL